MIKNSEFAASSSIIVTKTPIFRSINFSPLSFPWNNLKSLDFEVTDEQREEFTDIGLRHSADWELEVVIFDQRKPEYWNVFHKSV